MALPDGEGGETEVVVLARFPGGGGVGEVDADGGVRAGSKGAEGGWGGSKADGWKLLDGEIVGEGEGRLTAGFSVSYVVETDAEDA